MLLFGGMEKTGRIQFGSLRPNPPLEPIVRSQIIEMLSCRVQRHRVGHHNKLENEPWR
jgi:hypothetical protein